jgi:hypothetical protein
MGQLQRIWTRQLMRHAMFLVLLSDMTMTPGEGHYCLWNTIGTAMNQPMGKVILPTVAHRQHAYEESPTRQKVRRLDEAGYEVLALMQQVTLELTFSEVKLRSQQLDRSQHRFTAETRN